MTDKEEITNGLGIVQQKMGTALANCEEGEDQSLQMNHCGYSANAQCGFGASSV